MNRFVPEIPAQVQIHPSQFPAAVQRDLLDSLRSRQIKHKFHYDSIKQTNKWLALHQELSPSRNDADCATAYDRAFAAVLERIKTKTPRAHLVSLGCGGGQKDTRLLKQLHDAGHRISYTPSDVSTAMVLVAREAALGVLSAEECFPLVCDLATADDLPKIIADHGPRDAARLLSFFGMIPNFEPDLIMPKLAALVRPSDHLLFSANLAPGTDHEAGVRQVLPQYDNTPTRDWLLTFLFDLGIEPHDGEARFITARDVNTSLWRIEVRYLFQRSCGFRVAGERFEFQPGDQIRLFYSYRYTTERVSALLTQYGLVVEEQWIAQSGEEGVFLVKRT